MPRPRVWRNAVLALIGIALAFAAWTNRYEPAASPYFHRNRFTGAECHRGQECWTPRPPRVWPEPTR
ncbi:hypothetical protein WOC76_03410 [Methylocystis sp. IM3]|uniref:hypothetical protein n=1 Tax=unclassified Methylocystis TaxID=2625913 RepID=UPI000FC21D70|nr:MAG: hypothetical protein EKK29_00080 [Hyphomicrobiales bacterium]